MLTLGRVVTARGEVLLRRRGEGDDTVEELVVNGTFAMDSADTTTERRLARLACPDDRQGLRVLVGGLGLGYTALEALSLPVDRVDVVELEPALVAWARQGVTPVLAAVAADPRVRLLVADVAHVLLDEQVLLDDQPTGGRERYDAIALDVDNGPDYLIHQPNAPLYSPRLLRAAYDRLAPGGRLAVWCQGPSPSLLQDLAAIAPTAREHLVEVTRGGRLLTYAICTLDRMPGPA